MADKEFKTIEEQMDILRSRGLKIEDEKVAAAFLLEHNYYRISGYSLTLRKDDVFFEGVTFQNIIDIYQCDYEMRHILLKYIEIIEVQFKSVYAYEFTKRYGGQGYLDASHFTDADRHQSILTKGTEQIEMRLPHEAYLKHFINDLNQQPPLWAYVDLLTIANISKLYSISDSAVQQDVAAHFRLPPYVLGPLMKSMTIIRNLCAHGSRLFNRLFEQKPKLSKKELELLRVNPDGTVDNAHLYGFILVMRRLLSKSAFLDMQIDLRRLVYKYPFVRMDYYGFRSDWQEVL